MENKEYLTPLSPLQPKDGIAAFMIVLAVMLIMITCSCGGLKTTIQRENNEEKVRIEYREVLKIDTVTVQLPQERIEVIRRDSSYLETNLAISDARIQADGTIYHTLQNKPYTPKIEVRYKDRETVRDSIVYKTKEIPYPVEKELNRWQKFRLQVGGYAIFALLGVGIFYGVRIARKFIP